jgi:chromate transporter
MDADSPRPRPGLFALLLAFGKMGMIGFGGVAPWARVILVEERRWLTDQEFAEYLGMGQVLPGANMVNAAVMIGQRFGGAPGALVALLGMLGGPLIVIALIAGLYGRFGHYPVVQAALSGTAAAAAGMVMGTALRMMGRLKAPPAMWAVGAIAFLACGVLRFPLPYVVLTLAPIGILLSAWYGHRALRK